MSDQDLGLEVGNGFASEQLVAAREALGLSAEAIQRELRLTPRVVKALESGDLHGMGQPVFARGYIRSYCKRVGIEADPYVEQYDAVIGEMQPKRSLIREMASSSSSSPAALKINTKPSAASGVLRGLVKLVVVVGVLGGAAYGVSKLDINLGGLDIAGLFGGSEESAESDSNQLRIPGTTLLAPEGSLPIPTVDDTEPTAVAEEPSVEAVIEAAPQEPVVPEVQTEVVTSLQPAIEPAVDTQNEVTQAAEVTDETEVDTVVEEVAAPAAVAQPEPASNTDVADGMARFSLTFTDVSWVNIKDGKGEALFNGLAERGRTLDLTGAAPINFVFGRVDAITSFTFNGTTVDLAPHTKNNVARLSLPR